MAERTVAYDNGSYFRVEHHTPPHSRLAHEVVRSIGVVTMLPTVISQDGAHVLTVAKMSRHGTSFGLLTGNIGGGMDSPESATDTALYELCQEVGYGYGEGRTPGISMFRLREVSDTIDYPRFFAVMRDVGRLGGQHHAGHDTVRPTPLRTYVESLTALERGDTYPEVGAAFAKADRTLGQDVIMEWLLHPDAQNSSLINQSFAPWLLAQDEQL